ncbi:glycosyltransferase [Bacillus sp. FJAT-49705]|uniref:Glycosyltransferase n=1 Tax=Cytobacillus citreus TaxID=2833586 RepID=A0ABS5NSP5_9BACI|nr:glycosyltransferase [Cytobacillus citreus]MBS4190454.1 glycosyltransferase [Cytobacillus citreus]
MKKQLLKLVLCFMTFTLIFSPLSTNAQENVPQGQCISPAACKLKGDSRKLWTDHVMWTRLYIVGALAGLDDKEKVLARLLQNQEDLGNAIKSYYGEEAGNKLAELLKNHILIAGKVVEAAKSGNKANFEKFNKEWYKNADDLADFLSKANPNWSKADLKNLLETHLVLLTEDVTARLVKDWDASIAALDKGIDHIIKIADTLSKGIVKQFPNKF